MVVFQEIFGVGRYIRSRCADLAALGYVVLAPEIYWRLGVVAVDEGADDLLPQGMALMQRVDWSSAVADGVAAVRHARGMIEVTGSVGAVGFCFGGGLAFNVAAEEPLDVLVSYYGSALPRCIRWPPGWGRRACTTSATRTPSSRWTPCARSRLP